MTRNEFFVVMFTTGSTMQEIADTHSLTREAVRLVLKNFGYSGRDGGQALKSRQKVDAVRSAKDKACMATYGYGLDRMAKLHEGLSREEQPKYLYATQKSNAKQRGIPWEFTNFAEWWEVWMSSGQWNNRGKGRGAYVMSRVGDIGAYRTDNVVIITAVQNHSDAWLYKDWDCHP